MARKQQPTETTRATLQMPRSEAEARIREQIEEGQRLLELRIANSADLEQVRNEMRKWSDFNTELLKRIVDTNELVNEYRLDHLRLETRSTRFAVKVGGFNSAVRAYIAILESTLGRLGLIPESPALAQPTKAQPIGSSPEVDRQVLVVDGHKDGPGMMSILHDLPQYDYDVALSFAGEDRKYVERVAEILKEYGIRVFYDRFEEIDSWGKDLYVHLDEVYRLKARYCVMFISEHYATKLWTNHERKSAQARAFQEREAYILPARFDDTEIPGIRPTVGYVDLRNTSPSQLAEKIIAKLKQGSSSVTQPLQPADRLIELPRLPNHISEYLEQSGYDDETVPGFGKNPFSKRLGRYGSQKCTDVVPAQSWVSFVACPLEVPRQSSTEVIAVAKGLFDLLRWYNTDRLGPRYWGPGILRLTNGKGRTTRERFEWIGMYPDYLKTDLLRKYMVVWGSGCLEYGMAHSLVESGQDGHVFFRFVPLIGVFWRFLCAVREFEDEIGYEGESFIRLNMVKTKDSLLLDFAEGWREPRWERFVPTQDELCLDLNISVHRAVALTDLKDRDEARGKLEEEVIRPFATVIGQAYNQDVPQCFNRQDGHFPFEVFRDSSKYKALGD